MFWKSILLGWCFHPVYQSYLKLINKMELKYIHFIVYAIVFILYGAVVTGVGPIVIFFSKITGQDQTHYAFIFFARALGYLTGGQLVKKLTKKYQFHSIFVVLIVICSISLIVSSLNLSFLNLFISMFVAAACCCMLNILSNLCIFELFSGANQDYWIQMINLFFGIGGLIGPMIVIVYEEMAMMAIGIIILFTLIPFYFLKSPENYRSFHKTEQKNRKLKLSSKGELCICLLFFFYIAEEVGYANWIPTYAFKLEVADAHEASTLASIFWITNTVARLMLLYWQGKVEYRLNILLRLLLASTLMVVILQFMGLYYFVSYFGVISSGMCLSAMYALFFSIALDYGYGLSPQNTANFAMSASLGQGLLVMPIGYAMGFFGMQALIVIVFLMSAIMFFIFKYVVSHLEVDSKKKKKSLRKPLAIDRTLSADGQF